MIGPYKVQGNPYYVKESVLDAMFSPGETARNVHLRYDMYNQNIEFITKGRENLTVVLNNSSMSKKPEEAMISAFNYLNE